MDFCPRATTCMGLLMSNQQPRTQSKAGVCRISLLWLAIYFHNICRKSVVSGPSLYLPDKLPEPEPSVQNLIRQVTHMPGHTTLTPPPVPQQTSTMNVCILLQKINLRKVHSHLFLMASFLKIAYRKINPQAEL